MSDDPGTGYTDLTFRKEIYNKILKIKYILSYYGITVHMLVNDRAAAVARRCANRRIDRANLTPGITHYTNFWARQMHALGCFCSYMQEAKRHAILNQWRMTLPHDTHSWAARNKRPNRVSLLTLRMV